ncbi:MAG: secretion system protein [Chloroflexi bacterium]|nr:MAG: secretion system protein [Chloroflexota bacterium]MBL1195550.1 secretion system protein [Chloroflexota bacterium]NOH12833.1 secretion system protein [Chloroflexota bacterium]
MLTIVLWVGGGLALVMLVIGVYVTLSSERSLVEERLGRYLDEPEPETLDLMEAEEGSTPLTDWINVLVERSSFGDRIAKQLARADMKFKPGEYVAFMIIASFVSAVLGFYFGGVVTAVAGAIGGLFVPRFIVRRQQGVRLRKFSDQLPDMLNLMVNGIRAGFSTMQAMEAVSKEMPEPINVEFRRVVQEMQLGIPMEKSLDNLLRRIPSDDLDLTITAINVQREVGGNLAEILEIISHTVRERIRIKNEIKTLTAQVVYSGRFLALLPIFLMFILWGLNRDYMMQFFLEPVLCGVGMLVIGGIMIAVGYYIMMRIADIEV